MPQPNLQLGRYRDLAAAVAARLTTFPNEEVIVASAGIATAITAEMLRGRAGVAGLRLQSIDGFARRVLNDAGEYPRVAEDAERRLAMRTAARAIDDPMMESRGIAAMLERSYRDVRDGGRTLAEFGVRAATLGRARTHLILRAWRGYERLIAQLGAIDPADLLGRATQLAANASPQIVAGFYDMTGAQLRLIEALRDAGRLAAVFIPVADAPAYAFATPFVQHFSGLPTQHSALLHVEDPAWHVEQHDNRIEEVKSVCAEVAKLLAEGAAPRTIGIVARTLEPYDVHLLNRFASEQGFAAATGKTMPLLAHRIGRGLATLLRLRDDDFPRNAVIELLRDGFQAKRRVKIDDVDAATRRARIAGGTTTALRHVAARPFVDDYLSVLAELEALAPTGSMTGREAASLLRSVAERFEVETEHDLAAVNAIDAVAEVFRRAAAWRFDIPALLDGLEQEQLRTAQTELRTVWAGDLMHFRGRSFDHLFAIRMQDELFPQHRVEDPLLPDADRRFLGLREIGDGRDEERLLFQLLLDGASTSIHFSFAGSDGFGKALRPSGLVKNFVLEQRPDERAELLRAFSSSFVVVRSSLEGRPGERPTTNYERQLQLLAKSGTNSVFDGYLFAAGDDPAVRARLAAALQSVSPTQLEDFGECPQKFLVKHVLGARAIEDPEHELQMNARDKGKVDHGILERFYREVSEEDIERAAAWLPQLEPSLGARIDALVEATFDALERDAPPFNPTMREIERGATRRILREFLARDLADLHATGLRPKEFEYRCETTINLGAPALGRAIRVEGWIDRIDANAGSFRVVDYKGGKALRHKDLGRKIDRGVRLQLPLYAMAVAQFFGATDVSGAIKPLVFPEAKADKFVFDLRQKQVALLATLELFAGAILDGRFPAFPADTDKDFNACKYCPVNHSCRTKHDLAEKYAVMRHGDPRTLLGGAG